MKEVPDLIKSWIETYRNCPAEITEVVIALEYFNSFTTKILLSTLQEIMQIIKDNKKLLIKWYYEEDDYDILERGENISTTLKIQFEFIKTKNISDR